MNNYDNAEPNVLKTLNSSGQVLDDQGNVINNTSDYWVKTYNQAEPKPDKILYSDGTIKDSAGNLIQDTTLFNVKNITKQSRFLQNIFIVTGQLMKILEVVAEQTLKIIGLQLLMFQHIPSPLKLHQPQAKTE